MPLDAFIPRFSRSGRCVRPFPRRDKKKPVKGPATKEQSLLRLLNDMQQRIPTEIRWLIYEQLKLPARIVTLFLSSTTLRKAFGHPDPTPNIPNIPTPPPDVDLSPVSPGGREGVEDIDCLLATENEGSLTSIGRQWFPGGPSSTEKILDHPIRGTKLLAPPLHGVCDADCPVGYEFIHNSGIHGVFHPRRERFDFERDTLYLRLSVSSDYHQHTSSSSPPASRILGAMEDLRPSNRYWGQVRNLALAWKDPPVGYRRGDYYYDDDDDYDSGYEDGDSDDRFAIRRHVSRIRRCFPRLRRLVVVRKHYHGPADLDFVFARAGALDRVLLPPRPRAVCCGSGRRRMELLDLGRDLEASRHGFSARNFSMYCNRPSLARPAAAWRFEDEEGGGGEEGSPLDVVVRDIVPRKMKVKAEELTKEWLRRIGAAERLSLLEGFLI